MGQGFKVVILNADGEVVRWMDPWTHGVGGKLRNHASTALGHIFVLKVEFELSPHGMFHKKRLVWAGEYADKERGLGHTLYGLCKEPAGEDSDDGGDDDDDDDDDDNAYDVPRRSSRRPCQRCISRRRGHPSTPLCRTQCPARHR